MRTDLYNKLPRQLLIFDACANSQLLKITPPDDLPPIGKHLPSQEQMVMFAANPGEYAINKGNEQTGIFSRELLNELNSLKDTAVWPPDLESVMQNVQKKFIKLREDGQTKQTPSFLLYQDWGGNKNFIFE
ncbi:MAG: caspase family protein, partial [Microcystis sp.]